MGTKKPCSVEQGLARFHYDYYGFFGSAFAQTFGTVKAGDGVVAAADDDDHLLRLGFDLAAVVLPALAVVASDWPASLPPLR